MKILGIDPGLNISGYGVIEADRNAVIEAGILKIKKRKHVEHRLEDLYDSLIEVIESLSPDCMAIEDLYSHYERPKTAIIMGHARGVILLAAKKCSIPVTTYAATKIKSVMTGNGRAPKEQMQLSVCRHLGLKKIPDPPDVADALAIALCHDHYLKLDQKLQIAT
ncbi:crossover junction endodeoxyribonuclease RuvC [Pirellulaceae bacterium]|nr:crossover junction endodeoxyribonuclease RuvC [Pirellulaceae bacterium]MDB4650455.1 crossover junction endodeoxyribonuclease RuvC [Pirellulaceae bacterium]